jgi:hypothetical protein
MADAASTGPSNNATSETVISLLNQLPPIALTYIQITIFAVCIIMIVGGLIVFFLRTRHVNAWRSDYIQVFGTIFFFPTLIILAVYLNMSRDAVVGILGAFLGSLFTRSTGPAAPPPNGIPEPRPTPSPQPSPEPSPQPPSIPPAP